MDVRPAARPSARSSNSIPRQPPVPAAVGPALRTSPPRSRSGLVELLQGRVLRRDCLTEGSLLGGHREDPLRARLNLGGDDLELVRPDTELARLDLQPPNGIKFRQYPIRHGAQLAARVPHLFAVLAWLFDGFGCWPLGTSDRLGRRFNEPGEVLSSGVARGGIAQAEGGRPGLVFANGERPGSVLGWEEHGQIGQQLAE